MASKDTATSNAPATATTKIAEDMNANFGQQSVLGDILVKYIKTGMRFILVSPPAMAKTSLIHYAADTCGFDLVVTAAGTRERVDFSGAMIPSVTDGYAKELLLETMYRLVNAKKPTVWFLDDLGNAMVDVQAAIKSQITRGGIIAENPNIFVCAATNRPKDRTGVQALHESLRSEFRLGFAMPTPDMHKDTSGATFLGDWKMFVEGWCDWAWSYGAAPEIIAWHRNAAFRMGGDDGRTGSSLYNWQPNVDPAARMPDCRTWQSVIDMWKAGIRDTMSISAAIGKSAAVEFKAFTQLTHKLPAIDQIRMDPEGAPVPEDPAALYLISAILAGAVTEDWVDELTIYMKRMDRVYQALLMRDVFKKFGVVIAGRKRWADIFVANKEIFRVGED